MAGGDLPITADLAGAAVQHVEKQYGGEVVGFFLVGSCGDQAPAFRSKRYTIDKDKKWSQVDAQDAGWLLLTVQGERLGTEAVRVSETIRTSGGGSGSTVRLLTDTVTVDTMAMGHPTGPTKTYDFTPTGTADVPVWILQLGNGVFVGSSRSCPPTPRWPSRSTRRSRTPPSCRCSKAARRTWPRRRATPGSRTRRWTRRTPRARPRRSPQRSAPCCTPYAPDPARR